MNYLDKTGLTYLCDKIKELIPKTASEVGALAADGTAAKATEDADGNNIASTYATKTEVAAKADKSVVDTHTADKSNPHSVTKEQVGLGNVDNTADTDKPVSTATQTALNLKANKTEIIPNDNVKVTGKIISKIGWYRLASFKGTVNGIAQNGITQGSHCNSCEIILQRGFNTNNNEYHHIYFTGIFGARQFNSISNKSNIHLYTKIRYVEVKDENNIFTSYIDIYNYANANNDLSYKILNSTNIINSSWKPCFEYVGTDDINRQVVYDIPANSELAQKPVTLWSGNQNVSDSITDININTDISSTSCPYKSLQIIASAVNGSYVYPQPVQVLDINQIIANGCAEYYLYNGYGLNITTSNNSNTSLTFEVTDRPNNNYNICILEIRGVM